MPYSGTVFVSFQNIPCDPSIKWPHPDNSFEDYNMFHNTKISWNCKMNQDSLYDRALHILQETLVKHSFIWATVGTPGDNISTGRFTLYSKPAHEVTYIWWQVVKSIVSFTNSLVKNSLWFVAHTVYNQVCFLAHILILFAEEIVVSQVLAKKSSVFIRYVWKCSHSLTEK